LWSACHSDQVRHTLASRADVCAGVTRLCNVPSRRMAQFDLSWASNETLQNVRTLQDRMFGFAHRHDRTSGRRVTQIVTATLVRMSVAALLPRRSEMTGYCLTLRAASSADGCACFGRAVHPCRRGEALLGRQPAPRAFQRARRMPFSSDTFGSEASAFAYQNLSMLGMVPAIGLLSTTRSWWSRTWSGSSTRDCHRSLLPLRQCGKSLE
jgi:hypothetical protein